MREVHTFENGIKVFKDHVLPTQAERYAVRNLHEPIETEWVRKVLATAAHAGVFVDVGAANGYYCYLVRRLRPQFKLVAFEPSPENRAMLAETMALNGVSDIDVRPQAISATEGVANLSGASYTAALKEGDQGQSVPTTTLDLFARSLALPIALLKMDIQGAEALALRGARDVLARRTVHAWIIGTHGISLHAFCLKAFADAGYRVLFESQSVEHQPDGVIVAQRPKK